MWQEAGMSGYVSKYIFFNFLDFERVQQGKVD